MDDDIAQRQAEAIEREKKVQALLDARLKASGRSARQVAQNLSISDTRLRQIINGYQSAGQGQRVFVRGPASTIAEIAYELGISAQELIEADRSDAAIELGRLVNQREYVEYARRSRISASTEDIRRWVNSEDFGNGTSPDDLLQLFDDEQLLDEVRRRMQGDDGVSFTEVADSEALEPDEEPDRRLSDVLGKEGTDL